jgi:hypothetical protein
VAYSREEEEEELEEEELEEEINGSGPFIPGG